MAKKKTKAAEIIPSGAIKDDKALDQVDASHPAVDSDPRAGEPSESTQIDFNDPKKTDAEAVQDNLNDASQG